MTADSVGGVWTYAIQLCAELARHDVDVTLVVMGGKPSPDQTAQAASLPNVSLIGTDLRLEWMDGPEDDLLLAGELLLELAAEQRPDIVHLNGYAHAALPFAAPVLLAAHSCVPSWWQACRTGPLPAEWDRYSARVRAGVAAADLLVAPTAAYLGQFTGFHGAARAQRVIHNGCDPSRFRAGQKRQMALAAGRIWDEAKNIDALCRAADGLPWSVMIAGHATSPDGDTAQFGSNLVLLGFLPPDVLADRMAEAAVFAAPARYEPFGLSILEAALSGCALVLGDIPTLRELWSEAAIFVAPDDERGLRQALDATLSDPDLAAALGAEARRRAARYSAQAMGENYLSAYGNLLAKGQPAHQGGAASVQAPA